MLVTLAEMPKSEDVEPEEAISCSQARPLHPPWRDKDTNPQNFDSKCVLSKRNKRMEQKPKNRPTNNLLNSKPVP